MAGDLTQQYAMAITMPSTTSYYMQAASAQPPAQAINNGTAVLMIQLEARDLSCQLPFVFLTLSTFCQPQGR